MLSDERYITPEQETWKPIEMRKSRFGSKRVQGCECDFRTTCGPCLDDHAERLERDRQNRRAHWLAMLGDVKRLDAGRQAELPPYESCDEAMERYYERMGDGK